MGVLITLAVIGGAFFYINYVEKDETYESPTDLKTAYSPTSRATYICSENKTFSVTFSERQAEVSLGSDAKFTLEQMVSASGTNYSNDSDALVFWTKGEEAFVEQDGKQTYSECLLLTTSGGEIEIVEASIDKKITSKGVSITPLAVLEESRCPIDVVCIQAGTVRLRANLSSGAGEVDQVFKLNQKITTEAEEITLVRVLPATQSGKKIQPADYLFYFEVKKR